MNIIFPRKLTLLTIVIFSLPIAGQNKTNFELIDSLVNLSVSTIMENIEADKDFSFVFTGPDDYSVLKERVIKHFLNKGAKIVDNESSPNKLYYSLELANIKYNEVFKDGLFGIYLVEREANVKGMFNSSNDGRLIKGTDFEFKAVDSVFYSNISNLENIAYSFTQAELPDEPFFSSTLEPVIAIGTAAVAVYLFFNIRSK